MKKLYFSLVLMAIGAMCNFAKAQRIDRSHAKEKARTFINGRSEKMVATSSSSRRKASAKLSTLTDVTMPNDYLYGFNVGNNEGFVIVAADDSASVIGYADEGYIDPNNMPDGLKDLLQRMGANVKSAVQGGNAVSLGVSSTSTSGANKTARKASSYTGTTNKAIGPLLTTKWSQFEPYYNLTPTSSGTHCATCCVATAMAQIIYYLYCTQDGQTSTTFSNGITSGSYTVSGSRTYDWSSMLPSYLSGYTDAQATAIATLMRDCGYALNAAGGQITYGVDESTAYQYKTPGAYSTYFGVSNVSDTYASSSSTISNASTFFSKIDTELNNYRPVQVCGNGHSFVCDGRAADGVYYHFNFGYGGGGDGFYCAGAYNGYDQYSDMEITYGFTLSNPTSANTDHTGLQVAYNSAIKTMGLRPVGTIPGMYQQSYYETLKGYLDTAKGVLDGTSSTSDETTLISNIGTAEQNLVNYTTPYNISTDNTSNSSWKTYGTPYYIRTRNTWSGSQYGMYYTTDDDDNMICALYAVSSSWSGYRWRFIYDSSKSESAHANAYYIGDNTLKYYINEIEEYGGDVVYEENSSASTMPSSSTNACEVIPTDYLGDGTFAVTIRPMASGYTDDQDRYLCAWSDDGSTVEQASSTAPSYVCGGDPYGDTYSKWVLVPTYNTSSSSGTVPTVTTATASFSNSSVEIKKGASATQTVTTNSNGTVTYSSSDITVATVDPTTGAVTGVGPGTATITAAIGATAAYFTSGYTLAVATYTVTVTSAGPVDPTATFANANVEVEVGKTATNALTTNSDGTVTYSSSAKSVATVDASTGVVTGVKTGSATITASIAATDNYKAASVTYTVNVVAAKLDQTVTFTNPSATVMVGNTVTNAASTTGDGSITYKSSDETIATVDGNGTVTGVGIGTATITATAAGTSTYSQGTATYTVSVTKNTEYENAMAELLDIQQYLYTSDELTEAQNAGKTVLSNGLITASTQFSSPYTETKEGSFANLLDNDQSTFWHSAWSSGSVSAGKHYFIVALNEAEAGDILLSMGRRSNATDDHPTQFEVYGSNDNSTWTDITTLDFAFESQTETVTATFSLGASYTYLKFVCTNTGSTSSSFTTRGYFHMGEFQLYRSTTYPASETAATLVALSEAYSTANSAYNAGSVTKTTVDDLRKAINNYKTLGDVNLDGKVNIADVSWLIHYLKGNTSIKRGITDINADYKTNVDDVPAEKKVIENK